MPRINLASKEVQTAEMKRPLAVLHVIPSISLAHGGPSRAIRLMEQALGGQGVEIETATTDDDGPGRRNGLGQVGVIQDGVLRHYFPKWTEFYKIAPGFARWLNANTHGYDLIHIHALFSFTSVAAAWIAIKAGIPYIVRPLGVLNHYGRTQRRPWLKRLSLRFIEGPILRHAAAVHFTAEAERDDALQTGIPMQGVVIPLGVDVPKAGDRDRFLASHPDLVNQTRLLILSRLDPVKNVEGLIRALALLRGEGLRVCLIIAGSGEPGYVAGLQDLAGAQGVAEHITWLGQVEGAAKGDALAAADIFVLPSYSENFGIAVAEALACGLPCVVGQGVAISGQVADAGAGIAVATDAESIAGGLRPYITSPATRLAAGEAARQLAARKYSVETMGGRLFELYQTILRNGV